MGKKLRIVILFIYSSLLLQAQPANYELYENINLTLEATSINCITQDKQGLIWVGSNKGLFSYDGFSAQPHNSDSTITHIHCIITLNNHTLVLGTDNGIFFYDYQKDEYIKSEIDFKKDVRTMVLDGNRLWIGSLSGLAKYDFETKTLEKIDKKNNPEIPHEAIYSIEKASDGKVYIGTYNGLCYYDPKTKKIKRIALPDITKKSNQFINTILEDTLRNCIWIGTEGHLLKYENGTKKISSIHHFNNNSVKSLVIDENGTLLAGTDNGLYLYRDEDEYIHHIAHDSRNSHSLSNNIVWNIFRDRENNIWLGTDYNISLARNNKLFRSIPISQITGIGEGNRFHAIYHDSKNRFWLGGTNGLIQTSAFDNKKTSRWFRMGDSKYPLSHNRIRSIYEDKDRNIWLATDGSINKFDELTNQFITYSIVDSTHSYNANWAYNILEDKKGYLWITSFLGGIFVVDKQKLLQSKGVYVADYHYSTSNGLSGNHTNQIFQDRHENIWVLLYNFGLNKIDTKTNKIYPININKDSSSLNEPNYMLADSEGTIWAGLRDALIKIALETYETEIIKLDIFGKCEILSMVESDEKIWLSTSSGILAVDKKSLNIVQRIDISTNSYTSSFYDKQSGDIYWGASDEIAVLSPKSISQTSRENHIILTDLLINGQSYKLQDIEFEASIRYMDHITLNHKQNNLTFEFSDLIYSQAESNRFVYRLEGISNNEWNILPQNTNKLIFNNLESGKYRLIVTNLDSSGKPSKEALYFNITITPPWYYTLWAKIIYLLLSIGLIIWIVNFFRVRNNLRIERLEKTKTVELSNLKLEFFTNVSHEFKTPLSLIIAPVSKLLMETKQLERKEQLNIVLRNALKLNSLIRQVIDFNREDSINSGLILSRVEFVEFAKSLFSNYQDGFKDKGLMLNFVSNEKTIYINIDVLKMEVVLNNLLSNACKYTSSGEVNLNLDKDENLNLLKITITDTGIGIPKNEQPYIFERFFQSSKTIQDKEGTGIGLYLIKKYVDQHNGILNLQSEENKGTSITIVLPIVNTENNDDIIEVSSNNNNAPLILIVEDNPEIADFIYKILSKNYRCEICHNGKQGLTRTIELQPDLIVADIMMPIMDGLEMTKQIRQNIPISDTPIILLTAKDDRTTELESINLKVDAFIAKPFDPEILYSRIKQIITNKQLIENKIRMEALTEVEPIAAISTDEKFLADITSIIEDKIDDPELNVNSLSKISGYGSKQLYRKTKQLTGKTPVEYIRTIRLKKASILLTKKTFTISEVMYMVGFSSSSYFSKCFQQEFGMTPSQFIESRDAN